MAAKDKSKKTKEPVKEPKKNVVTYKANINLLKNLNAVFVVAGFLVSLVTIGILSSRSENYDVRSRSQVLPTITLTPSVSPTPSIYPSNPPVNQLYNNKLL